MADEPTKPVDTPVDKPADTPADKPADTKPADIGWQDKLKDKSPDELVKMYGEAMQKIGEHSGELGTMRKEREQMAMILTAIGKNPDREKMVRTWIEEMQIPEGGSKPKEEKPDETRSAMVSEKILGFERRYGLDKLEQDKRKEEGGRLANALWEMVDPKGEYKTWDELITGIPLAKLDRYLDNAYFVAHRDEFLERIQSKEEAERRENEAGSFAGMTSAAIEPETMQLSIKETDVAKKLGVSPEKYLERKKQIAKGL